MILGRSENICNDRIDDGAEPIIACVICVTKYSSVLKMIDQAHDAPALDIATL